MQAQAAGGEGSKAGDDSEVDSDNSEFWDEPPIPTSEEEDNTETNDAEMGYNRPRRGKSAQGPLADNSPSATSLFLFF